jgi:hypothetical protein
MSAAYFFDRGSHMHYADAPATADYAVAIRSAECTEEINGPVVLEVKHGGAVLSYATDLRKQSG